MPLRTRSWTVACRACDLVIGAVEGGHFVHDPACPRPLAIGSSVMRCCQCGGPLSGDPRPLATLDESDERDEVPVLPLLHFGRSRLDEGGSRQRV